MTQTPARLERPAIRQTTLLSQSWAIARRNFLHIRRMPEMLLDVTIQPVMFVLLFAYVFGSSISVDTPAGYRAFLLAGIMAQTVAFAAFVVAVGLTSDLQKGIVDRMRSLPINPAAVLVGRSISSLVHSSIGLVVMSLTGLLIGWRIHTNVLEALLGYVLLLGWGFAMIWVGILVGSAMRSVEAVNGVMFATIFPITFLANTFAPTDRMPAVLRTIAEWNPISSLTQAVRELWGNDYPLAEGAAFPMHHPIPFTIGWILLITAVVAPLAIRTFRSRTAD
jgi:ABC-type polysaccharide/polyol phosphate export permease